MTGNLAENFKNFKQQLQIYFDATESHTKKEATQVAILLNFLGSDGLKIYNTLKIPSKTVFEILKALEAYCIPKRNETMELYKFFTRKQLDDKLLKTQIILGISDKELQAKLLREELILENTVKHCQIVEQSEVNRKLIQKDTKTLFNIEAEQNKGSKQFSGGVKSNFRKPTQHKQSNGKSDGKVNNHCHCKASVQSNFKEKNVKFINFILMDKVNCTRCGRSHKVNDCPAYEYEGLPLLSYEACVSMQYKMPEISIINSLITNNEMKKFIEKNIDVFEGIGKCPDKVQIKLTDNAIPKSNPPRRVPMKIMPKLKEQLERMVKLDIIKPCENLTEWQIFKRLPFGISMAPELFQKRMSKYFGDIECIQICIDDVLICANSREEYDQIMMKVLDRARRLNIKFNAKKVQFAVKEVKFLGFVFNMQGVMPDPERIKIIKELSSPTNKKQLQSFLGMINYLRAFIPNFRSKIKEPMLAHDTPDIPFYKIAMDIAELRGDNYLIVIDYYSRWIEIVKLKVFAKEWNFKLAQSSPYYAQSNGLAEKGVGIAKDMLKKSLSYSPAQLLQSRELKSTKAINRENQLKPEVKKIHDKIVENKKNKNSGMIKTQRSEDTYVVDQPIYVQDKFNKLWNPAIIVKKLSEPRSYLIKTEKGKILRRTVDGLKKDYTEM
ncbi:hypothetical protein QTP88_026920 [Uroleucon formosanum]